MSIHTWLLSLTILLRLWDKLHHRLHHCQMWNIKPTVCQGRTEIKSVSSSIPHPHLTPPTPQQSNLRLFWTIDLTCGQTPSTASTTMMHPSQMRTAVDTSEEKSTCPGESIRLIRYSSLPEIKIEDMFSAMQTRNPLPWGLGKMLLRQDWTKLQEPELQWAAIIPTWPLHMWTPNGLHGEH